MATNGYVQPWQQQPQPQQQQQRPPPPRQYQYDQRNDPRAWQDNQQFEGMNHRNNAQHQGYSNYTNGYAGYDSHPYDQPRQRHHDNQYQEPYQGNGNGHYQDPYDQGYQPRNDHNGEQFHPGRETRPQQGNWQGYENEPKRHSNHKQTRSSPENKQKSRERILPRPSSPKTLAWDNPFGTFPPKKKDRHDRHTSLDKGLSKWESTEPRPLEAEPQRPRTSQGHRKREDARPNTSHGYQSGPVDHPQMPQQEAMPRRKDIPPQNRIGNTPLPSFPLEPARRPGTQRSFTDPTQQVPLSRPPQQLGNANGHGRPVQNRMQEFGPKGHDPVENRVHEFGPNGYAEQNRRMDVQAGPIERQPPREAIQARPPPQPRQKENYDQGAYRGVPLSKVSTNRSREQNMEMPNFDAIPTSPDENVNNHFSPIEQSQDQPAYNKKTYQAQPQTPSQSSYRGPSENSRRTPVQMNEEVASSPLAEFTFDLPPSTAPALRNNQSSQSLPYRPSEIENQRYPDPRYHVSRASLDHPRQQPPVSQFPPRSASRADVQSNMAREGYGRPRMDSPRDIVQSPEQVSSRLRKNRTPGRDRQDYNQGNQDSGFPQQLSPVNGSFRGYDDFQGYENPSQPNQGYGYPPNQQPQQPYGQQVPPRKMTPHEPFDRNPNRPPTSGSSTQATGRRSMERRSLDSYPPSLPSSNPDSLPAHPAPVRPGLAKANTPQPSAPQRTQAPPVHQQRDVSVAGRAPPSPTDPNTNPKVTVQELNGLREKFKNNPNDNALGLRFAKRLVEAANVLATENGTADPKQTAKNRERYIFDSHKILKRLVSAGYPEAMFYLADCHGSGNLGLAVDPKEAFSLYQSAAKLNHAQSAYRVAVCCELGQDDGGGTRRDPLKAVQWYKRAATLGDPPAMYKMGMILLKGLLGQPRNSREAISWLKRAAERADKENPHALHELGLLYESASPTDHIIRDEKYAFQLFQQAADLGYKYSQFRLGSAFEYGLLNCMIDPRQSIAWYTRAASQGEHQSELALSGWYLTGSEPLLQQSDTEAYLWARKAASSGLAKAEYAMGYFTEVGIGTAVNLEDAKRWYYRAAAQNFGKARERLEDLKRGGQKMQKTRVSRSNVGRHNEGECLVM